MVNNSKTTKPTHDISGHKMLKKELTKKEKDLKEIISKIENVHSKAVDKLKEIRKYMKEKKM